MSELDNYERRENEIVIREYLVDALGHKFQELGKRAKRLGVAAPTFQVTETWATENEDNPHVNDRWARVLIQGEVIRLRGYTFLAGIDHEEGGNIIDNVSGEDLPESWRTATPWCEHCKLERRRLRTYVLRKDSSGEIVQVGSTCLRDFLGVSPERVASRFAFYAEWTSGVDADDLDRYGGGGDYGMDPLTYLTWTAYCIRHHGWTSRSKAREELLVSATADSATSCYYAKAHDLDAMRKSNGDLPNAEDKKLAEASLEYCRNEMTGNSEFVHNLRTAITPERFPGKRSGLIAAAIVVYRKHMEWKSERQASYEAAAKSTHFGEVKKRENFVLTLTGIKSWETDYGSTHLHKFMDQDGNIAAWFASGCHFVFKEGPTNNSYQPLVEGHTYEVRGTVKTHDEFRGIQQTVLTRCQIIKEIHNDKEDVA